MSDYPEHDKLNEIQPLSQAIGEFLAWLEKKDIWLCTTAGGDIYRPTYASYQKLLAEHFGIDLDKIEAEKRQMLERIASTGK